MGDTFRAYRTTLAFGFRAAPWHASCQFVAEAVMGLRPPLFAYGGKLLIDAASESDLSGGLRASVLLVVAATATLVAMYYYLDCANAVDDRTNAYADKRLMQLLGGVDGLAHHERPDYLDETQRIREERSGLAGGVGVTTGLLRSAVAVVTSVVLLAEVHVGLLALLIPAAISLWFSQRMQGIQITALEETTESERLRRHLFDVGTAASAGKELRVFGIAEDLLRRHHETSSAVILRRDRADREVASLRIVNGLISAGSFVAAIAAVMLLAVSGGATPGDVVLVAGLAASLGGAVGMASVYVESFLIVLKTAQRYVWLEDYVRSANKISTSPASPPKQLNGGISLIDVSFRYPGTDQVALDHLSLHLSPGSVVALVGENGAGKTTMVKLLCDFYRPDEGRIMIDGIDLQRIPTDRWHKRVSGAFQDHTNFEFLTRENVGISDLDSIADDRRLHAAVEQAGATDVVAALPSGLDTQLGTRWDGADLSGGQWQKLALARGLVRSDPLLVVFDEPTAALDPQTEHALFERLAESMRSARRNRAVTLLVSHRFSTVRMADLIIVLDSGQVRELGSHSELMNRRDLYAELYELQSRAYQ